jgi:DNA-binding SARP family transcriptional activator/WD40 repeat protein/energy-coupling factor transporter ATP-binding protein EcfA2
MGIAVLGPLQIDGGDTTLAPRERVVLVALVVRGGETLTSDQLAEVVWGEQPPATWPKALQSAIVKIRKTLGAHVVQTVDHGYRLTVPPGDVDAREFERLVGRARELLGLGEPDRAAYALDRALGLWRGPPLADVDGWEPGRQEADRLLELRHDAEELQVDAGLRAGHHREVLDRARRLVEQAPLRERRWELLAVSQYRCGQQADALRTLQRLRRVLVSELGIDPGPEILSLETAILRQDPELQPATAPPEQDSTCPYLGLVPYDVGDSETYFGRDAEVAACRSRLAETGVLAVVGPSGSGKSSLVRAGLAAALRADGERVVVLTPGRRPISSLSAVPTTGRPVVLVVDQAEEAVMLPDDPAEIEQFFAALTEHAGRGRLVVALRADRFGDLAAHAEFARLVERGLYVLTPMSGDALREAIEGPARLAGLRLEPGLVELLVAEVEGQPGALPHLSHALRQTWERREGGVLTLEGYRATGGIRDAVARSAERVYDGLPAEQRSMLRDVMLRLVSPGSEGEPVRTRVPRRLLSVDAEHEQVMEQLVAARLVTSDDGVVELAHEALARSWPRLLGWLDEDTEGQRIRRHLSVAADTWDAMGRPADELYRGSRLAQALEWRTRARPDLVPVEAAYLVAGELLARREEDSARDQARYQAAVNRRLRGLLVGVAMLLLVSVVTGTVAVRQANRAADASRSADARRVAAQAQLVGDVDLSLALAAAALRAEPTTEARAGLLAALARAPQLAAVRPVPGTWMAMNPDGRSFVTMANDHKVRFFDAESYEQLGEYDPYPGRAVDGIGGNIEPLEYSSDGTLLAVNLMTVSRQMIRVIDTSTYEPVADQPRGQPRYAHPQDPAFSPDGRYLAVSAGLMNRLEDDYHPLYVWDLARPQRPLHEIEVPSDTFHVEFSPDGRRIHAAPGFNSDAPPGLWTWSTRTGELLESTPHGGQGLEASADGSLLAYADRTSVVVVDEASGTVRQRFEGPRRQVWSVAVSPDGELVAATSEDPAAFVWEVSTGRLLEQVALEEVAYAVGFGRDGEQLLVPGDGRLRVFDLTGTDRYVEQLRRGSTGTRAMTGNVRYASPYAPLVAHSRYVRDRGINLLAVRSRATDRLVHHLGRSWSGNRPDVHAWSPDGRHLAIGDEVARLRVWDLRQGTAVETRRLDGSHVAYTADGSQVFLAGPRGLMLLDAETLRTVVGPVPVAERIALAELVGDDRAVVVGAQETSSLFGFTAADRWAVVDLTTGKRLRSGRLREPATSMAVAPDLARMAVAGPSGVEVVDLVTGESTMAGNGGGGAEVEGDFVTYSPDGRLLASSDSEGRVSLWHGHSSELLGTVRPDDGPSEPMFVDDETLSLQYSSGGLYRWDTSDEHAVETTCRIVGRGLTVDEWQTAFGDREYVDVCAD